VKNPNLCEERKSRKIKKKKKKKKKFLKRDVDSDSYANLCRAFEKYLSLPNGILLTPTKKLSNIYQSCRTHAKPAGQILP